ncbi:hypothetical protein NP493_817g00003 [Ridgeia piscesae]|uniref:Uncharacterized protein n=1 Tax=Ridgeia piscesae TaxID=27915 RepID=A0AAD9NL13_RIDPI|nr:hypothetical protein NP493_817g00003 [Ridgeia piscesae]
MPLKANSSNSFSKSSLTSAGAETICLSRNCTCAKCVVRAKRELLRCSCSSSMLCSRSISSAWMLASKAEAGGLTLAAPRGAHLSAGRSSEPSSSKLS